MEKKKRVVFLSRYVGVVNRGVETYVLELSKRLKSYFEVDILTKGDSDSLSKITQGNYDVVIPTNGRLQALKVFLGKFFSRYKVIIPGQAGVGKDDIWNIFITCPDVYIALTDYEKEWAKKWTFWNTKIVKISNGVDLERFKPIGSKININLEPPLILSVGALEWYKHHELTIKALAEMNKGSLLIVGKGSQKDFLTKLGNKLLGEKRFKIIDVPFEQMPEVYRSADLFVLPSWIRESFGIVYVEAMATNIPVVTPDDSPRKEIVGDGGVLTDVFDAKKYANALEQTLLKDWKDHPRKQAENFSWDKIAQNYKELIEKL